MVEAAYPPRGEEERRLPAGGGGGVPAIDFYLPASDVRSFGASAPAAAAGSLHPRMRRPRRSMCIGTPSWQRSGELLGRFFNGCRSFYLIKDFLSAVVITCIFKYLLEFFES